MTLYRFRPKPVEGVEFIDFSFTNKWGTYEATVYYSEFMTDSSVVVFAPGGFASKDYYMWIVEALTGSDFLVVTFNVPKRFNLKPEQWSDGITSCIDALGTIEELNGVVDDSKIGVMGHSMGGLAALLASHDSRITCVIGLAPAVFDVESWDNRLLKFLYRLVKFPTPNPDKITIPIQIQQGTCDRFVPYKRIKDFYDYLPLEIERKFVEIEGNHMQFMDERVAKIVRFFDAKPTVSTELFHTISSTEFINWFGYFLTGSKSERVL